MIRIGFGMSPVKDEERPYKDHVDDISQAC